MFDDLKYYLHIIRLKLVELNREDIPIDLVMEEVCSFATNNWINRQDGTPNLTENQINKVITRVIAKRYNNN